MSWIGRDALPLRRILDVRHLASDAATRRALVPASTTNTSCQTVMRRDTPGRVAGSCERILTGHRQTGLSPTHRVGAQSRWRYETETRGRTGHQVSFNRPHGQCLTIASCSRDELSSGDGGFAGGGSCSGL